MTKNVNAKDRKINVLVGFTQCEITFLDRKVKKKIPEISSRSALIRLLVRRAMEKPETLIIKQ